MLKLTSFITVQLFLSAQRLTFLMWLRMLFITQILSTSLSLSPSSPSHSCATIHVPQIQTLCILKLQLATTLTQFFKSSFNFMLLYILSPQSRMSFLLLQDIKLSPIILILVLKPHRIHCETFPSNPSRIMGSLAATFMALDTKSHGIYHNL